MMPQFNMCRISRYTISNNSNPKHNTTKSMVGLFPLDPHHDYYNIYLYHVFLIHRVQNWGVTFLSPFNSTVLSALQNLNKMLHRYRFSVPQD